MGIIYPYFPKDMALKLAATAGADTFIETGTFEGDTTKWAATKFKDVYTIELSEQFYNAIKDDLIAKGNITPCLGDSRKVLPELLRDLPGNVIFWLDGHYSGGDTAGQEAPCPLREELEAILARNNDDIVLIDDARCCKEAEYPSIAEIYKLVRDLPQNKRFLQICDDHIYIVPDQDRFRDALVEYGLDRIIPLWELEQASHKKKLTTRLYRAALVLLEKMGLLKIARKLIRGYS